MYLPIKYKDYVVIMKYLLQLKWSRQKLTISLISCSCQQMRESYCLGTILYHFSYFLVLGINLRASLSQRYSPILHPNFFLCVLIWVSFGIHTCLSVSRTAVRLYHSICLTFLFIINMIITTYEHLRHPATSKCNLLTALSFCCELFCAFFITVSNCTV